MDNLLFNYLSSFSSETFFESFKTSAIAAMFPRDDKVSFGSISLLAGLVAISLRASTCFNAITLSSVPDSIIAVLTFLIASASAIAIASIALALPSASSKSLRKVVLCHIVNR